MIEIKLNKYYSEWCASKGYKPIFCLVSGSHLFGLNTKDSDVDFRGVHVQPVMDYADLQLKPRETHIREKGILDFKSIDVRKFIYLFLKGNIIKTTWLFTKPYKIYNNSIYNRLRKYLGKRIPYEVGNSVFGLLKGNYIKYIKNREGKEHDLAKKFLLLFLWGKVYEKTIDFFNNNNSNENINFLDIQNDDTIKELYKYKKSKMPLSEEKIKLFTKRFKKFKKYLSTKEVEESPFKKKKDILDLGKGFVYTIRRELFE